MHPRRGRVRDYVGAAGVQQRLFRPLETFDNAIRRVHRVGAFSS
jgi:hypothetical protein